jgi:bd-type cytochrome oxidase subunit I
MVRPARFDNRRPARKAGAPDMDLLFARWQMGLSLAFHIVFAVIGMAMPVMMIAAKVAWVRTGRSEYLDLAKRWAHLTLAERAAPENVRVILLQVLGVVAVVLIPSLLFLFGIFGPRGGRR